MKRVLGILLLSLVIVPVFPGGEKESGRVAAMDMVSEGTFVAEAFLDEESFLDDYRLEHSPAPDAALSVFLDVDKPLVFHWGDVVTLQISVATTDESFYPAVPFSYVLFFNDPESLEDENTVAAIAATLEEILDQKKPDQRLYVFLQKDERVEELKQSSNLMELLDMAKIQAQRTNPERALESMLTVGQAINDSGIKKYFWVLGKPVADSKADIQDVKYLIAAYGSTSTEISFCGYDESFRPETVNRIVRHYGGNSYYISNPPQHYQEGLQVLPEAGDIGSCRIGSCCRSVCTTCTGANLHAKVNGARGTSHLFGTDGSSFEKCLPQQPSSRGRGTRRAGSAELVSFSLCNLSILQPRCWKDRVWRRSNFCILRRRLY
jgi:hypothetical protein